MTDSALKTQGIVVKRGDGGGSEVFTAIAEVYGFAGLGGAASAETDVTTFESLAKEFLLGLPDEGEITLNLFLLPSNAQQEGLWTDRANQTLRNFQIHLTDSPATVFSFAAYVKSFNIGGQRDGAVTADIALRVSGAVTWS